jgi:hypothetical protein
MSSHSNSSSSSPPRVPPHIRLNSGHEDLLSGDGNSSSRTLVPTASRPTTSRSQLNAVYSQEHVQDSAERLLPPGPVGSRRHGESPMRSPARSSYSSRRSSWESDRSRDSRGFENPFRDSNQDLAPELGVTITMSTPKRSQKSSISCPLPAFFFFPKMSKRMTTSITLIPMTRIETATYSTREV